MSNSLGDFDASAVIYGKFSTFRPTTGATFTLAGSPVLSVYKDNSVTQSTTGVTLTADFDSVTGLNHFAVDTSADGTFYAAGSFFDVVITTGTVDSVSVTGTVVASFTIRKNSSLKPTTAGRTLVVDASGLADANTVKLGPTGSGTAQTARDIGASVLLSAGTGTGQLDFTSGVVKGNVTQWLGTAASTPTVAGVPNVNVKTWNDLATVALPLVPTTAGRTLDVSVGGEAGLDWANVGSPTTALALTGTTIATTQKVDIETIKTQAVTCAGGVTVPAATLASTTNITAGTITTVTNLTNAPTAGDLTATMKTSVQTAADAAITANVTVSSVTGRIPAALVGGRMDSNVSAIGNDTTALTAFKRAVLGNVIGTCDALGTTTSIITSALTPAGSVADQFKGRIVTFDKDTTTAALRGQSTDITASSASATPTLTVTALTTAAVSGDTFTIT